MYMNQRNWKIFAVATVMAVTQLTAHAVDSASLEYATASKVRMVRAAVQWDWESRWFQSNGTHIGGYWDLSLAQWRGSQYRNVPGDHQNITSIGFTPVFRFQQDSKKGFYAEAGIGVHLMSQLYDNNDDKLSTAFQFGDHIGIGYVFDNKLDVGLKYQHFSNGGIKSPNSGVDFTVLRISYPL